MRNGFLILSAFFFVSCGGAGIMENVPVRVVSAEKEVPANADTSLLAQFTEVGNSLDIQIVNDTILVLMDQVSDMDNYHFKAYSTKSSAYLGSFLQYGRGPGEMISPRFAPASSSERYLTIKENAAGRAFIVDVESSIRTNRTVTVEQVDLPEDVLDWFPLPDSEGFVLQLENRRLLYRKLGRDGAAVWSASPYNGIDAVRCMPHLSSVLVLNGETGMIAEVMLFLPQVNIFDTADSIIRSVAVDKDYRQWRSLTGKMLGPETVQYYVCAAASPDFIFAAYRNAPLADLSKESDMSIHIFDWSGRFLCEMKVSENIVSMAYDNLNSCLYAIEQTAHHIVRYNLNGLL